VTAWAHEKKIHGRKKQHLNFDESVKSPMIVMPDLVRYPEHIEITG